MDSDTSQTITTVRAIITKFHKSHLGASELKIARKDLCIGRGLEAIGKTRFGTIIRACIGTETNSPAIKKVVERKKFDLAVRYDVPLLKSIQLTT